MPRPRPWRTAANKGGWAQQGTALAIHLPSTLIRYQETGKQFPVSSLISTQEFLGAQPDSRGFDVLQDRLPVVPRSKAPVFQRCAFLAGPPEDQGSSDFDTVLQVYAGPLCRTMTEVSGGCNDDDGRLCAGRQASVRFAATANINSWPVAIRAAGTLRIMAQWGIDYRHQGPMIITTKSATCGSNIITTCTSAWAGASRQAAWADRQTIPSGDLAVRISESEQLQRTMFNPQPKNRL